MGLLSDLLRMGSGDPVRGRGLITGAMRQKQEEDALKDGREYRAVEDAPSGPMFALPTDDVAKDADDEARRLAWAQLAGYQR